MNLINQLTRALRHRPAALPTGVVTFVMTDVVSSTALWERAPGSMDAALRRHDRLVAAAVAAEHGVLLKSRGEGDSTFSVFTRATDAVRVAYRLQQALQTERWPSRVTIAVRVGIHTGEAYERGGNYFGPTVNRTARLRDLAGAGQVVMSGTTATIVRGLLPPTCDLVDLGWIELRGLTSPERAVALVAPDLAEPPTPTPIGR
jgi:class 3 adenylate cyclase